MLKNWCFLAGTMIEGIGSKTGIDFSSEQTGSPAIKRE